MTVDTRVVARREDARLGLFVLVYGLVLSPLVHAVVQHGAHSGGVHPHLHDTSSLAHAAPPQGAPAHAHETSSHPHGSSSHSHGVPSHSHGEDSETPGSHRHGAFSVEHLQAVLVPAVAPLLAVGLLLTLSWVLRGEERRESGSRLAQHPAMPQGP